VVTNFVLQLFQIGLFVKLKNLGKKTKIGVL